MNRYDRSARRLVVCPVCRHDKSHVYRAEGGVITVVCAGCGYQLLQSQEAAAPA